MKIFLTGSRGYVGKNLLTRLRDENVYLYKRGEDIAQAVQSFQPEIIYHLAGETRDESKMMEGNFYLTQALVDACRPIGYKAFIYLGSSSEYGIKNWSMKETSECKPTTIYGRTKLLATNYCQLEAKASNKNIIILRPFSTYGDNQPDYKFIPSVINACLKDQELNLLTGNHDWTHVDDLVSAILYFSDKTLLGEIINTATGVMASNETVVELIQKICGKEIKIKKNNDVKL